MTERRQLNATTRGAASSATMGFVLGAVVGAGITLLLAPTSGKETRRRIAGAAQKLGDATRDRLDRAGDVVPGLEEDAQAAVEAGRKAFEHAPESKDLREGRTS